MKLHASTVTLFVMLVGLLEVGGCGSAAHDSSTTADSAPMAANVTIIDHDSSDNLSYVGHTLTGDYQYTDAEQDPQGQSQFRWYRDDAVIDGATLKAYTLIAADSGKAIRFEVTPVAIIGTTMGTAQKSDPINVTNSVPTINNVRINWDHALSAIPEAGITLNVAYTYRDLDGDEEGDSVIQWYSDGVEIPGANTIYYTLTSTDNGKTISVTVTPVAKTGAQFTGPPIEFAFNSPINSPPVASNVSIEFQNPAPGVGDVLTGHYTYSDPDSDAEGASTFRWLRNGNIVVGSELSYTLTATDIANAIIFEVTPVAQTGVSTGAALLSGGIVIGNAAPTASNVTISSSGDINNTVVGDTLAVNYTYFDQEGDKQGTSLFRWMRDGVTISGATKQTYTLVAVDSGKTISVEVTPQALTGTTQGIPVPGTNTVAVKNSPPTISGLTIKAGANTVATAHVNDLLSVSYTYNDVDNDPEGQSAIQWLRTDKNATTTPISGATSNNYKVAAADSGNTLSVSVIPIAATGGATQGTKQTSSTVTILNSVPVIKNVVVNNTGNNGNIPTAVLHVTYDYSDIDGDLENTAAVNPPVVQWKRNGVPINGANALDYTLGLIDAGKSISVDITPLAKTGLSPGVVVGSAPVNVAAITPALNVNAGLKQLQFSWNAITGATYYTLSQNPDGASGYTPLVANATSTSFIYDIAVHRMNWPKALFMLEACDATTCISSAAISALSVMLNSIGHITASNPGPDAFGARIAISSDGNTLAVGAYTEQSAATGINPTTVNGVPAQDDNSLVSAGAVYVYTRNTSGSWSQQAYIKPFNTDTSDEFGYSVALSSDGNTLAVGARGEASAATGVNPTALINGVAPQYDNSMPGAGAAYVFFRSGGNWSQQAYIKTFNTGTGDDFGYRISLSGDGNTLAVGADYESSAASGVNPTALLANGNAPKDDDSAAKAGAAYVFIRNGAFWSQQAYVKASNTSAGDYFGTSVALSSDASTLVVGANGEASGLVGVPSDNTTTGAGAAYVFTVSGTTWTEQAYLKALVPATNASFGFSASLSSDGNTLAVAATGDGGTGAAYVFTRTSTTWNQPSLIKASNAGASDGFGYSIALSNDGNTLAVGAPFEASAAKGIGGDETDNTAPYAGAAYVYTRNLSGLWSQQAYVKSVNTVTLDSFGLSVSLNADGNTLAVCAYEENNITGGVYLY